MIYYKSGTKEKKVTMKTPSELIAWAAGIFEGEGSVGIQSIKAKYGPYTRAVVSNTDLEVLEKFKYAVGFGVIDGPYAKPKCKPIYLWRVSTWQGVERLYDMLETWLCERRRGQFQTTLSHKPPYRKKRYYKLSEAIEDEIKARYSAGGISQSALAREYGVCGSFVCRLVKT